MLIDQIQQNVTYNRIYIYICQLTYILNKDRRATNFGTVSEILLIGTLSNKSFLFYNINYG